MAVGHLSHGGGPELDLRVKGARRHRRALRVDRHGRARIGVGPLRRLCLVVDLEGLGAHHEAS
eukprot:654903-Prymnesium_polylepis.1